MDRVFVHLATTASQLELFNSFVMQFFLCRLLNIFSFSKQQVHYLPIMSWFSRKKRIHNNCYDILTSAPWTHF